MERQQKLLWTLLSVAILVLVLLGAGMFFFLPADSTGITKNGKAATPVEWSKATTPAPTETSVPAVTKEQPKVEPAKTKIAEIKTPVQVEKKAPVAVQPTPVQTEKKTPEAVTKPVPASAGSYWIQVGSFGSMDTAEKIKGQLSAKGYKSTIQTISANGKTFHRVKLGPYATKDDINSILPKIKALDGMSGSFMTTK